MRWTGVAIAMTAAAFVIAAGWLAWVVFTDTIVYNTGRLVLVAPDPLSPGVIVSASGQQRDLCELLA